MGWLWIDYGGCNDTIGINSGLNYPEDRIETNVREQNVVAIVGEVSSMRVGFAEYTVKGHTFWIHETGMFGIFINHLSGT